MQIDMRDTEKLPTPGLMTKMKRRRVLIYSKDRLFLVLLMICCALLVSPGSLPSRMQDESAVEPAIAKTVALNDADRWKSDTTTTVPSYDFPDPGPGEFSVSPPFQSYYQSHQGSTSLGAPLTVAFPTERGWMQFFASGALLLPSAQQKSSVRPLDPLFQDLIESGLSDSNSHIVRLPLLQSLLTVGSLAQLSDSGSSITYSDLRQAINPDTMLLTPDERPISSPAFTRVHPTFIKEGTRGSREVGYLIPPAIWTFINRPAISPDGWKKDFGDPLTQVLTFTIVKQGRSHQIQIQVFGREGVMLDKNTLDASGQPKVQMLPTGQAYLRTVGPPAVTPQAQQRVWVQGATPLLSAPKSGLPVAHVGQNFPMVLLGNAKWNKGDLWYHIQWTLPKKKSNGWVEASAITFNSPGSAAGYASIDTLSSDLARYLATISDDVNVAVYDITRNRYYTFNSYNQFITGSSMKVAIMLTLLDMDEDQGHGPDDKDMALLTKMIENSDNDAASQLYFKEIGGAVGVANYLAKIGITGLDPNSGAWGYSLITPMAMVNILTDLYEGKILNAQDRNLAMSLMESVETDQQFGVGDTAPAGATFAMKNGWLPGPDGLWAVNSSGIVMNGNEVYIVSVYTKDQNSFEDGQALLDHVCGAISGQLS